MQTFEKFQFSSETADFAGFTISSKRVKPLEKFINAIQDFPTPSKITDVRSWFGLVNQVSHYDKLSELMAPFKHLLSPRSKFDWTDELENAFRKSKELIVNAIRHGVEIYDPSLPTCLRPDWSKTGIGYYLSQKCCDCTETSPDCCPTGWEITLAGSRFLKPSETRYAPVEGEALAIAWSLEQTRHFTQGCDELLVVTDHKPLVKLFSDRTLDEITNPRLFKLKQRTLMWRFTIQHSPGKLGPFSDAASRHPVNDALSCIRIADDESDDIDSELFEIASNQINDLQAITWQRVKEHSLSDPQIKDLAEVIQSGFPQQ